MKQSEPISAGTYMLYDVANALASTESVYCLHSYTSESRFFR